MNNKTFHQYLCNRIKDCETHGIEPTRVLEALYILSDYMNQAGDSNIDVEDGHMFCAIYNNHIDVIDNRTGELLNLISFEPSANWNQDVVWTEDEETDLILKGRILWCTMSDEQKEAYYCDTGTYGFIENLCTTLRLKVTDDIDQFERVHEKIINS